MNTSDSKNMHLGPVTFSGKVSEQSGKLSQGHHVRSCKGRHVESGCVHEG